jgi:hypothetical protein
MTIKQKFSYSLSFRFSLPGYDDNRCAFYWTLTVHCWSDKLPNGKSEGKTVAKEDFHSPLGSDILTSQSKKFSSKENFSEHSDSSSSLSTKLIKINKSSEERSQVMIGEGMIRLTSQPGKTQIERATLLIRYWPDRGITDGYAEASIEADFNDATTLYYTDQS